MGGRGCIGGASKTPLHGGRRVWGGGGAEWGRLVSRAHCRMVEGRGGRPSQVHEGGKWCVRDVLRLVVGRRDLTTSRRKRYRASSLLGRRGVAWHACAVRPTASTAHGWGALKSQAGPLSHARVRQDMYKCSLTPRAGRAETDRD